MDKLSDLLSTLTSKQKLDLTHYLSLLYRKDMYRFHKTTGIIERWCPEDHKWKDIADEEAHGCKSCKKAHKLRAVKTFLNRNNDDRRIPEISRTKHRKALS